MPSDPISPELIEAWVAGTLSQQQSDQVERYLEEHPNEIPELEIPELLTEVDPNMETGVLDPDLTSLIERLKSIPSETEKLPSEESWRALLEGTADSPIGKIHHYEILDVIATTGMATVLKARDSELNRLVAIKILSPGIACHSVARERFIREARAMAALEHENILPIFAIHPDATPWFAMPFVEGGSLQDALDANDPLLCRPGFLEALAHQIGQALEIAHSAGVIHRDLKPANILLSPDRERFWLADFGIALSTSDPSLTYGSAVAGTPRYMSPEQAAGDSIDPNSDLYSLGGVLFHCAAGRPPFEGDNSSAILNQVMRGRPPAVAKFNSDLPRWLAQLIDQLLSKDPKERPAILPALERKQTRHRSRGWLIAAASLVLLSIAAWVFLNNDRVETLPQNVITVRESGASYQNLSEAIRSAPPGATLELRGDFVLDEPIETLPHFGLNLVAAPGAAPIIRIDHGGSASLTVNGSTRVSGLHFIVMRPPDVGKRSILCVRDAALAEVQDCTFEVWKGNELTWAVQADAVTKTKIRRCAFRGRHLLAVFLSDRLIALSRRDGNLDIEDCLVEGTGMLLMQSRNPETRFLVEARRIVFRGSYFITASSSNDLRQTTLRVFDSLIHASRSVVAADKVQLENLPTLLTWTGNNNRYFDEGNFFVKTGIPPWDRARFLKEFPTSTDEGSTDSPLFGQSLLLRNSLSTDLESPALGAFAKVPAFPVPPFLEPREQWEITIEETGEKYADLSQALANLPLKATLLLQGEHILDQDPGQLICHDLTLRSTGADRARILINHQQKQGIHVTGNFRAEGIVFVHSQRPDYSCLIEITGAKQVELTDCQFLQGDSGMRSYGLRAILCKNISLTRCLFAGRKLNAIYISNGTLPTIPTTYTITLKDCLLDCERGFYFNPAFPRVTFRLDAERLIFRGLTTFESGVAGDLQPTHITLRDSIIQPSATMFYFNVNPGASFPERIRWDGKNNIYSPSDKFLVVRLPEPEQFLTNLDEFLNKIPTAKDEGSRTEALFEGLPLNRRSLPPDFDFPALKVLDLVR